MQDLAGLWTVEALSDELSALADTILAAAIPCVWADTPKTHTDTPQIGIIGYGKLGGKELGYTSDLDLVYVYDDPHPDAPDIYGRFARRLTSWLSAATGAGTLYDVDLRLRPNGDSGFLACSVAAFEKYQRESAWTWEHQSLTRARFITGFEKSAKPSTPSAPKSSPKRATCPRSPKKSSPCAKKCSPPTHPKTAM